MKRLSYDAAWADVVAMFRANRALLATVAGSFLFLPGLARLLWAPMTTLPTPDAEGIALINAYLRDNLGLLFVTQLAIWLGTAALLLLLIDRGKSTVGEAIKSAATLLLGFIVIDWLAQFAVFFAGLFLFVLPGIYLLGRLSVAGPALVAERIANPLTALQRSFDLTRGNGWRVAGLVLLVWSVAFICGFALTAVLGSLVQLILPDEPATAVVATLQAAVGAGTSLALILLAAALYRQLNAK